MGRILVADDHDSLRRGIVRALSDAKHEVDEAPNGNVAIEKLHEGQYDVVVSDLKMGGSDGMDVLRTTKALHPTTAVILMTAFGSVHTAVEAMKIGAVDFVQKPFEIEEMELKIEKAIEIRHLKYQVDYLRQGQQDIYDFDRIVGASYGGWPDLPIQAANAVRHAPGTLQSGRLTPQERELRRRAERCFKKVLYCFWCDDVLGLLLMRPPHQATHSLVVSAGTLPKSVACPAPSQGP